MLYILIFLQILFEILPFGVFCAYIFKNRFKRSRTAVALAAVLLILCYVACAGLVMYPGGPFGNSRFLMSVVIMSFAFAECVFLVRGSKTQITFVLFFVKGFTDHFKILTKICATYCFPDSLRLYGEFQHLILYMVILLLMGIPYWIFLEKLVRPMVESSANMPYWRYLWILPVAFYLIFRLGIVADYSNPLNSIDSREVALEFVWMAGISVCYIVLLRMLGDMDKNAQLRERLHVADIQLAMQKQQYEDLQQKIEETRQVRHDQRHHLLVLEGYIDRRDLDGLSRYLSTFKQHPAVDEGQPVCENNAVDSVIRHYMSLARENGVQARAKVRLPQVLPMPESELCILLCNLMENAVEACSRQIHGRRFFTVTVGFTQGRMLAVRVENSYEEPVKREGGQFLSHKREGFGVGLASVHNLAEKYGGVPSVEYEGGVFRVAVLLNPYKGQPADMR